MLEHIILTLAGLGWLGASVYLVRLCQWTRQSHVALLDAISLYAANARLELERAIQQHQTLTHEVTGSYRLIAEEFAKMADNLDTVSLKAVERMSQSAKSITESAAITCQQILHSAFPDERLNFSWHAANSFMCYYCQHRFPLTELEQLGPYKYCKEHGLARQKCSSS